MSWHFSRALAEEFSAAECSVGEPSVLRVAGWSVVIDGKALP